MRKPNPLGLAAALLFGAALLPGQAAHAQTGAAAQSPPLAAERLLAAQARLAYGLVAELEGPASPGANLVVSPASAAAVLALLDLGADAGLRAAIHRALGFQPQTEYDDAADLAGLRAGVSALQDQEDGPLALAGAILFDPKAPPHAAALEALRAAGAEASVEDLTSPAALARINGWVRKQTKGLIPSILEEPPREPGLVALSALHFKDRWLAPFDPADTRERPFRLVGGGALDVPLMRQEGSFRFRQSDDFVAVDLPYATDGFALTIVTSRREPLAASGFAAAASWLDGEGFVEAPGELALPRFELSETAELLPALDALGLAPARLSPGALAGLSPAPQAIARVVQRTVLKLDEAGTEAAAATAVTTTRSMPQGFVKMVVDRPFLFALRDGRSGLVLIAGYVGSPAPEAPADEPVAVVEGPQAEPTRGIAAEDGRDVADGGETAPAVELEVAFPFDSAVLSPAARQTLAEAADALRQATRNGAQLMVAGHTDARGSAGYNRRLSQRRAEAVKAHLAADLGIDPAALLAVGYGPDRPKEGADPFAAANRRVEVSVRLAGQAGR